MHASHGSLAGAALVAALLVHSAPPAQAAWPTSPFANLPIATATSYKSNVSVIPDGSGGAMIVWEDNRSGNRDIYAQRVSVAGVPLWTTDGVPLCVVTGEQTGPSVISDGAGGAIVAWQDPRSGTSYDIYAQRIDANGVVQWTADGVGLCTLSGAQTGPKVVTDGAGGAMIAWQDARSGTNDIYAQRVDASGTPQWTANGVAVCTASGSQAVPVAVSDGAGGMIIAWEDARGADLDVYARLVDASGVPQWTADGVIVCAATGVQSLLAITTDGVGGALLAWRDQRSGSTDVYAGRISSGGVPVLTSAGVAICTATGSQNDVRIASDGVGGAYVAWSDQRDGPSSLYAQRMGGDGARFWTTDGIQLESASGNQGKPQLLSDGSSGVLVCWHDTRTGVTDIYGQRVSGAGALSWAPSGVPISTASGIQANPAIGSDGAGGAIVAWEDIRSGSSNDVYAQQVERFGMLGDPAPAITDIADVPNDQGGHVSIEWTRSYLDAFPDFGVDAYSVWRRVPSGAAIDEVIDAEGDLRGSLVGLRAPRVTIEQGQAVYWEFVASLPARGFTGYSYVAATTSDSIAGSNPLTAFQIMAERDGGTPYWASAPDSGYSVDDLAPAPPALFAGGYEAGTTSMQWQANAEGDLAGYRLYRGLDPGFEPGPGTLVAEIAGTSYEDAAGSPYIYKLIAFDVHGNESSAVTLMPGGVTGVTSPNGMTFALSPPAPNPVRGTEGAAIRYALPERGHARLAIFDVHGRRVRTLASGVFEPGSHTVRFDARDDAGHRLAPGIYLVALDIGVRRATEKILLVR